MIQGTGVAGGTFQLYDRGEENWPVRLHLGCGNVYLDGYVNCDVVGELARNRPDLVEQNRARIDDYYCRRRSYTDIHHIPQRMLYVVDRIEDLVCPDWQAGTVDKIVCIQALEHLKGFETELALCRWWKVLRPGGVVVLSVPDTGETVRMLLDEGTRDFAIQHLAGTRRSIWDYHRSWFTPHTLGMLLDRVGFEVEFLDNIHVYPAIVVRARKGGT